MEQELDAFTQRRVEIILEIATSKMQKEIQALKDQVSSLTSQLGSLKNQFARMEIQSIQTKGVQQTLVNEYSNIPTQTEASVDNRIAEIPKKEETAAEKAHRQKYGDYDPKDFSINKFFYYGGK